MNDDAINALASETADYVAKIVRGVTRAAIVEALAAHEKERAELVAALRAFTIATSLSPSSSRSEAFSEAWRLTRELLAREDAR